MRPSPRKRLAVAARVTSSVTALAAVWWAALHGMARGVFAAWITAGWEMDQ